MFWRKQAHPYRNKVDVGKFDELYDFGIELTGTSDVAWRRDRFFNLYSVSEYVKRMEVEGVMADVGVWRGLSTFILLQNGLPVVAVDSFEGLSKPTSRDGSTARKEGAFANSLENFRRTLKGYSDLLVVYKGWIPNVLKDLPESSYSFVHIDLDLVEPTLSAFDYFYPRMTKGGFILFDDYASKAWENLKKETDRHLQKVNVFGVPLSTGQLLVIKT